MPAGRPSSYTPEIGNAICEAIAHSEQGLRGMLKDNSELPALGTVIHWLNGEGAPLSFRQKFAQAKQRQIELMAEDIVDISRDDTLEPNDKRLRIDTRKWLLSKLIPRTYGDKLDLTSDGQKLEASTISIDQRVQSLLMQAEARRKGDHSLAGLQLDANALKLLD